MYFNEEWMQRSQQLIVTLGVATSTCTHDKLFETYIQMFVVGYLVLVIHIYVFRTLFDGTRVRWV